MTFAPRAIQDEGLARRLVEDFSLPERGVLPEGAVSIKAPLDLLLREVLTKEDWGVDEPWTPLFRGLAEPVKDPGVRIRAIDPEQAQDFADVLRSAFNTTRPTREYRYAVAGAAALREMGLSSVRVRTPSSSVGGVAAYMAAGFEARPEVRDRIRTA